MKFLHVIRSLRAETGGLVEAVRNLSQALQELGHSSHTVSLDPADASLAGTGVTVLGESSDGYGKAPAYPRWLREHRGEFDAVIVHGLWQYQTWATWGALRGTSTPYFVFAHGMLDPWFKRTYPLKHLKKWLYWPWAEYRVLRDATGVCFTSEDERREARKSFWLYRARELIVPLGIEPPPGDPVAQREMFLNTHASLRDQPFLLFLGRIHPKKGLENVFRAYAAFSAVHADAPSLVIVGPCADPIYLLSLMTLTEKLGIARAVRWLGMATGDLKWGALHACGAFFLLSHQENFGVAVVEALACGKPVLISKQINIWHEIVSDGAAWAVQDSEVGAAEILRQWRMMTPEARVAMGRAAARCYRTRFEARAAAGHLAKTIAEAIRTPAQVSNPWSPLPPLSDGLRELKGDEAGLAGGKTISP